MKKLLILSFLLFFILTGCQNKEQYIKGNYNDRILLNGIPVNVEIVSSDLEMQKGLSGRELMCENCGMLFLQGDSDKYSFWMHEMKFPLDMIYINKGVIVEIYKNIPIYTEGDYTIIKPKENADMILELNANWCDKNNIKIGDEIKLINN